MRSCCPFYHGNLAAKQLIFTSVKYVLPAVSQILINTMLVNVSTGTETTYAAFQGVVD